MPATLRSKLGVCVLLVACNATHLAAADAPKVQREESWQVLYLNGQRVGYARMLTDPRERDGKPVVHTGAETHMTIKRFGQTLTMATLLTSEETLDGDLLDFTFEMKNPPAQSTKTTGKIEGQRLSLETEINGTKQKSSSPWTPGVKSPAYQDRLLRENPLKPGETMTFEAFLPEFNKPAKITVAAGKSESVSLLEGKKAELQKIKVTNSLIPGIVTDAWIDAKGETIKSSTAMLGQAMETYTVSRDEAMKVISVAELDLGISTLVKTRAIPNPYATKKVVYRITIADDNPTKVLPTGETQSVKPGGSDDTAELTVTAVPLPQSAKIQPVADEFTKSTSYLQSDDEKVQEHAKLAAGDLTDPAQIARAMEKYVRDKLTNKNFSTALASAGEVARKLEGDCTEHACLLAAMLRAKQIPSRVTVGLVYVEGPSAFGGHMWTEANLDGKWFPLDATLGRGGTGATHIKLGDATFADEAAAPLSTFASLLTVIGKLKIEVVSVE
jgi:transglutaminase-like putative cysteine protease